MKIKQDAFPNLIFWEEAKVEWFNLEGHRMKKWKFLVTKSEYNFFKKDILVST